eukprot:TRINITY_DN3477_c0_g1_i9.p1 TRINITY_DN3477_c0_g1~~TRINITY_DN3477_c0_g1_i9.p1  ORF type:complete len:1159 (+),score=471.85 TRINITY_DN3477_c0_g1_i9:327-3803(+)
MSSIKRYPHHHQPPSAQFYLTKDSSKPSWTEDGGGKDELEGDEENLLDGEVPPGEELPQAFSLSLKNLDVDPYLRLQKEEADTWANSIPPGVHSALKPHEAKRQEHIYEFIMTEKHHCQLLKVIQRVFCEGMVSCLDMKPELLDRLFPQLDNLISIHFQFLRQLRAVQDCGTVIPSIADVLLNQFNAEAAVHWQTAYGAFCSQHTQAVNLYKDLLKTDRRFQEFVQHSSQNPLLRKMGIPECILTISTRITKYPLLIEPLIKTAKDRPEERQKLDICHQLVKSILVDVNGQVAEKERAQRLIEIYNKLDAKSYLQVDGRKFKKSDFLMENRKLLFEGVCTLTHPQLAGNGPVNARGNRSPAPTPVNLVILSDVLVFLQESSQKYVFVSPENRAGIIPVHTLLAKKVGSDNKALQIISTLGDGEEPDVYEVAIMQPRDRQDWINGIRRAVDMSGGGSLAESSLEIEMEKARRILDIKYMRMKQRVGELRERDMDLARTMEAKMATYAEIFEELGIKEKLPEIEYSKLVQERSAAAAEQTAEDVLKEINAALQISSTLPGGARASDAHHASSTDNNDDDNNLLVNVESSPVGGGAVGSTESGGGGGEDVVDNENVVAVAQLTHHLNNILCIVSEKFTSQNGLKVEVNEWKEKAALGLGRYKHNQQLEQLRTQQDQLTEERQVWATMKQEQERDFRTKQEQLAKLQASLEQEKKDVEQQRDKLYRKLEALKAQGIDISPNMTVIGAGQPSSQQPEHHFIMEVRKAVPSPSSSTGGGGGNSGSGSAETARKSGGNTGGGTGSNSPSISSSSSQLLTVNSSSNINSGGASVGGSLSSASAASTSSLLMQQAAANNGGNNSNSGNTAASLVNQNLLSATIQTKGEVVEVKQQIPSKLAKLSLAGGNKNREKKTSSVTRPSVSNLQQQQGGGAASGAGGSNNSSSSSSGGGGGGSTSGGTQQLLPYKLSESEKKISTGNLLPGGSNATGGGSSSSGVSPKGYQKLSSSSFAEDRVGRSAYRGGGGGAGSHTAGGDDHHHHHSSSQHARTGSSPAAMSGRPMSSNTLPKLSQPRGAMSTTGSAAAAASSSSGGGSADMSSPASGSDGGGSSSSSRHHHHHHSSSQQHPHHSSSQQQHPHHSSSQQQQQPMVHRVNYSDSGEEVFFF